MKCVLRWPEKLPRCFWSFIGLSVKINAKPGNFSPFFPSPTSLCLSVSIFLSRLSLFSHCFPWTFFFFPDCPGTHSSPLTSASRKLHLEAKAMTPRLTHFLNCLTWKNKGWQMCGYLKLLCFSYTYVILSPTSSNTSLVLITIQRGSSHILMNSFIDILSCLPPVSLFPKSPVLWICPISYTSWGPLSTVTCQCTHPMGEQVIVPHACLFSGGLFLHSQRHTLLSKHSCPLLWA